MISGLLRKAAAPLIAIGIMAAAAAFFGWLAVTAVDTMIERAVQLKANERDATWRAEVETANTKAANAVAAQASYALELERQTSAQIVALTAQNKELEKQNAALPDGDACGLGRDRIRLLPH